MPEGANKRRKGLVGIVITVVIGIFLILIAAGVSWGIASAFMKNGMGEPPRAYSGDIGQYVNFGSSTDYVVTKSPPLSDAIRTEKRNFHVTCYCPPAVGQHRVEGGQTTASGIRVALGSVAVPPFNRSNPDLESDTPDYPWGTTFEIPGYGKGVAMDHGCAIQKAGVAHTCRSGNWGVTDHDHLDIFVGHGTPEQCRKWSTKTVEATVYWFDPTKYPPSNPSSFIEVATRSSLGSMNFETMDFRNTGPALGEDGVVGKWEYLSEVFAALGAEVTERSISKQLVSTRFWNKSFRVNKLIAPILAQVEKDIKAAGLSYEDYQFNEPGTGGYNWRDNVNSEDKLSPHSTGLAIDLNPQSNPNRERSSSCTPRDPNCCTYNLPKEIISALEKNGFFWGAKFYKTCDAMHFQYGGNYESDIES